MRSTRDELDAALDRLLERPDEREHLEQTIEDEFGRECAVLVVDMTGFARETQLRGIVSYLALIRAMRNAAATAVETRSGRVVKAEADNLFCVFGGPADAIDAARELVAEHDVSIGIGYGRVLDVGDDVWGDEVNLASKLGEDVAERGEILLTEGACAQLDTPCERRLASISGLELVYYAV
jgi:class 3 adenylate cyclase